MENLREIGPWLFAPSAQNALQGQYDFLCNATDIAGDAICGWLSSAMSPPQLAEHLGHGHDSEGPGWRYLLLRFHTEQAFPVLHARPGSTRDRRLAGAGSIMVGCVSPSSAQVLETLLRSRLGHVVSFASH
ncbi:hypothetical protein CTI14_13130 [Methylobacterium radiotolerans]|nr:hypothetical protein CTI14_13130 [Methylobacterium radiotolerans]